MCAMMSERTHDVLAGSRPWAVECSDTLAFLRGLPDDCCDLVIGSPPYEEARLYLESGEDLGIARDTDAWVAWMLEIFRECLRVCRGLVAFVVEGQTVNYRYSGGPVLLWADLIRAGICTRKAVIFHRVGIPGSGGNRYQHEADGGSADWLRNDYEFVLCATRGGKLPWADALAMGHPPKWAPGGEMSHRVTDGTRVNQWGGHAQSSQQRRRDGSRQTPGRPSHVVVSEEGRPEVDLFGNVVEPEVESKNAFGVRTDAPVGARKTGDMTKNPGKENYRAKTGMGRATRGKSQGDAQNGNGYDPPVLANPGNVLRPTYTLDEVRQLLAACGVDDARASEVLSLKVGGGQMGNPLCHHNEAPYPEALVEFFVRSFCPADGVCLDPFLGSGTTGAVAVRWGRRFVGCDLRESQCILASRRISGETPTLFKE